VRPATWRHQSPPAVDFFAAKGVLGGLLDSLGADWTVQAEPEPAPFLHPGSAASVTVDGEEIGWIGEIHPQVAAAWDWSEPLAAFELDLDAVAERLHGWVSQYRDVTSFPEVREDLAVIVAETVSAAEVLAVVRHAGAPLLSAVNVFDVYRGEQTGEGNVSLALRIAYRAPDRTLTDDEVAAKRRAISAALADRVGGRVRES
jgi:phenylalanyl-tRNA synthetase beta chain